MNDMEAQDPLLPYRVETVRHRALGRMVRLQLADDLLLLDLTPEEAHTLALALTAVREGRSPEREIFMSPIASDGIFVGRVVADGMSIATKAAELQLNWVQVGRLAKMLQGAQ